MLIEGLGESPNHCGVGESTSMEFGVSRGSLYLHITKPHVIRSTFLCLSSNMTPQIKCNFSDVMWLIKNGHYFSGYEAQDLISPFG